MPDIKAQNETALASVKAIYDAAEEANTLLGQMETAATSAGETLTSIYQTAADASTSAASAQASATSASASASAALGQLDIVENVVGVLNVIQSNGTYNLTSDTVPLTGKWYFIRSGSGTAADPYTYSVVSNPASVYTYILTEDIEIVEGKTYYTRSGSGTSADPYIYTAVTTPDVSQISTYYERTNSPVANGFYQLDGIDDAVRNYVSNHLIVDSTGVWLQADNTDAKLKLTTNGVELIDENGHTAAIYGSSTVIGDPLGFHLKIGSTRIGFWNGDESADASVEIAHLSGDELYITKTVVVNQMDLGLPYNASNPDVEFGQWSWKIHKNINGKANLNLKWIG